jgi:hypothetical protein
MLATPDKVLCIAIALTAVLVVGQGPDPRWLWRSAYEPPAIPLWLSLTVLIPLALASGIAGILQPQQFAAARGGEMIDPELLVVAFARS